MSPFKTQALTVLTAIMLSTPLSLVANALLNKSTAPQVVSFDLKRAIKQYSGSLAYYLPQLGSDNLSSSLLDEKATIYARVLEEELARYAQEQHAVIMVQSAIIKGAMDITPEIERRAQARINPQGITQ
jgi:conjugal transfer pilin signal peptidase TrbI